MKIVEYLGAYISILSWQKKSVKGHFPISSQRTCLWTRPKFLERGALAPLPSLCYAPVYKRHERRKTYWNSLPLGVLTYVQSERQRHCKNRDPRSRSLRCERLRSILHIMDFRILSPEMQPLLSDGTHTALSLPSAPHSARSSPSDPLHALDETGILTEINGWFIVSAAPAQADIHLSWGSHYEHRWRSTLVHYS